MPHDQKHGEVLWPVLVANKIFRRPMIGNSFNADFPNFDAFPDISNSDNPLIPKHPRENKKDPLKYKVFVSTWNVGGTVPPDDLNLEDWLDTRNNSYDIYVLGFQEIVPLSARNVLGPVKNRVSMKWNSLIRATLNKSLSNNSHSFQESQTGEREKEKEREKQKVYPIKEGGSSTGNNGGDKLARHFRCIVSKQMVGIFVSVWVRGDLLQFIRRPSVSCVGCGIMGCLGNKGSVSVRFWLHETSFCFVCCHLASGGRERDGIHRNSNAMEILSRTSFPHYHSLNLPQKILDHDRIILLGDLNYRISLPEWRTRLLVEQKEWSTLIENDQLRGELSIDRAFEGWQEGAITFSPTYKYYPNSDTYYGCIPGRKGEKRRAPAWCDRILWHGQGLKQIRYDRCESRLSDHRPVRAVFSVQVDARKNLNSLRSFFLSDRFDWYMTTYREIFTRDDQERSARFSENI